MGLSITDRAGNGNGLYTTAAGSHRTAVFGRAWPGVTAIDVELDGVTGRATIANGVFVWIGGCPADTGALDRGRRGATRRHHDPGGST